MAKNNMQLKYKKQKRERNKTKIEYNEKDEVKSFLKTILFVLLFIGVIYASILGLDALGAFEKGYTAPTKGTTEIDYSEILIGSVFNRGENNYYVLFDDFGNKKNDVNVQHYAEKELDLRLYKVNMITNDSSKFISETSNTKAKKASDLKINGITLIKITKGKISKYITGSEEISDYLKSKVKLNNDK